MLDYIKQHWRGNISLAQSFWVNLALLFFVLELSGRYISPPFIKNEMALTIVLLTHFVVVKLIIYPWQVVGVLRACDLRIKSDTGRVWATAAQAALVLTFAATLVSTIGTYQTLQTFKQEQILKKVVKPVAEYSLELIKRNTLIHLRGPLQIGITNEVASLIEQHPEITGIILDSDGGQLYEGRGLARLIKLNRLNTFSLDICLSSCTTAFVAGTTRTLGTKARLGFHQYKTYSLTPSINIESEQAKDMAIFVKQGVSPEFLGKIFLQPPEGMWWPEIDELVAAGVVHQTEFSFGD